MATLNSLVVATLVDADGEGKPFVFLSGGADPPAPYRVKTMHFGL